MTLSVLLVRLILNRKQIPAYDHIEMAVVTKRLLCAIYCTPLKLFVQGNVLEF